MHNILFNQQMRPTQTMAHDAISVQSTLATRSAADCIQDNSHCVQVSQRSRAAIPDRVL